MELDREYPVKSMEAAFEHLSSDENNFQFTFDIYGKSSTDTEWQTLFAGVNATRLDDGYLQTLTLDSIKNLKSVRIVITSITNTAGDPWPALAEFKIFADTSGSGSEDTESIAYKKPVHTNAGGVVSRINDGSTINTWTGERYPAYVDIDLEANYKLDEFRFILLLPVIPSILSILVWMDGILRS